MDYQELKYHRKFNVEDKICDNDRDTEKNAFLDELTDVVNPGGTETLIFDNNELIGN